METGREETEDIPANGNGEVIMVVEDEVEVLNLTKTMLESLGYNVLPASSPNKAMELAGNHEGPIDLLITDVIMPEMNGREIADQLKTLYPDISILFMSDYTENVIAHHNVVKDGVYFIEKPFTLKDIAAMVRDLLSSP